MRKTHWIFISAAAFAVASPAFADELLNACIGVVEAEGQPEGVAGCECLVEEVDGDEGLTDELLALAELPAEERVLSRATSDVISQCFALPDDADFEDETEEV